MSLVDVCILDVFRGSSRLDSLKSQPMALLRSPDGSSVMDWIDAAISGFKMGRSIYVGGYQIQKVIERFPKFEFRYSDTGNSPSELKELLKLTVSEGADLLVVRGETLIVPEAIKELISADGDVISGHYRGNKSAAFAGTILVKAHFIARFFSDIENIVAEKSDASLDNLFEHILVNQLDLSGKIAPVYDKHAVAKTVFKGKAGTLEQLGRVKSSFIILDQINFSVSQWRDNKSIVVKKIQNFYPEKKVVVRSSAISEDSCSVSAAGYFESILNVKSSDVAMLESAINKVIDSYSKGGRVTSDKDIVLVQEHLDDLSSSGVLFTREPHSNSPYFVVCIDRVSGCSDVITSGQSGKVDTYYVSHNSSLDSLPQDICDLVSCAKEQIRLTSFDSLDIEFAIDKNGIVYLFQLRPLVENEDTKYKNFSDEDIFELIECSKEFFKSISTPKSHLVGQTNILANMCDWNPVEMIGSCPNPLALSLYQSLIGNKSWAKSRKALGYRDVIPSLLILSVGGKPYVDVRASLNSFLPENLADDIAEKWVNFCLARLRNDPTLNDKVEFELLPTCFCFCWSEHEETMLNAGLKEQEISSIKLEYRRLTNWWLESDVISPALKLISDLSCRRNEMIKTQLTYPNELAIRINGLIDDCKRFGVVPFATLARMGFVALIFLRSLRKLGIFSTEDLDFILRSISTVARDINSDITLLSTGKIDKEEFVKRYGHLRENSYEVMSLNYENSIERYLENADVGKPEAEIHPKLEEGRERFLTQQRRLDELLNESGLSFDAESLFEFIQKAISAREYAKFEFMKSVNEILETVVQFGERFGLTREDMSYLPLQEIINFADSGLSGATGVRLRRTIGFYKKRMLLTRSIKLPDVISCISEIEAYKVNESRPNFVTHHKVTAPIAVIDSLTNGQDIKGKIVAIQSADPGYDWIFSHQITGLITQYGGLGSHMAVRAAEFSLPAAIGCGADLFETVVHSYQVTLDCANQRLVKFK